MSLVKVVKSLQALAAKVKAYAIRAQERKLRSVAADWDAVEELAEARREAAAKIYFALLERADNKQVADETRLNEERADAAIALDELNPL